MRQVFEQTKRQTTKSARSIPKLYKRYLMSFRQNIDQIRNEVTNTSLLRLEYKTINTINTGRFGFQYKMVRDTQKRYS